jgi:hypothetical protein
MIYLALVCSVTPAWFFFETLRINLSFLQHVLAAADMGKGSRGGGYHLQGLHAGAVVLTLAALVHLLRVTAKRVTINNEVGSKRWQCAGDLYLEAYKLTSGPIMVPPRMPSLMLFLRLSLALYLV